MIRKTHIFLFVSLIALCAAAPPNILDAQQIGELVPVEEESQSQKSNDNNENSHEVLRCIPTKWGCIDPSDPALHPRMEIDDEVQNRRDCACITLPGIGCIYPCDAPLRP